MASTKVYQATRFPHACRVRPPSVSRTMFVDWGACGIPLVMRVNFVNAFCYPDCRVTNLNTEFLTELERYSSSGYKPGTRCSLAELGRRVIQTEQALHSGHLALDRIHLAS